MKDVGVDGMELVEVRDIRGGMRFLQGRRVGKFVVVCDPSGTGHVMSRTGVIIKLHPFQIIDENTKALCTHTETADEAWVVADDLARFVPDGFVPKQVDPNSIVARWLVDCFTKPCSLRDWCKENGFPDPVGTIKLTMSPDEIAAFAKGFY